MKRWSSQLFWIGLIFRMDLCQFYQRFQNVKNGSQGRKLVIFLSNGPPQGTSVIWDFSRKMDAEIDGKREVWLWTLGIMNKNCCNFRTITFSSAASLPVICKNSCYRNRHLQVINSCSLWLLQQYLCKLCWIKKIWQSINGKIHREWPIISGLLGCHKKQQYP